MHTRLSPLTALSVALFLLASCAPYREIEVKDLTIDNISMQGSKIMMDFSALVSNPNRAFVLSSAQGELNIEERPFATAQLVKAIQVPAKTEQRCSGQLQLSIKDLVAALQLGFDAKGWDMSSFICTGDMQVRSAWMKKKLKYKEVPLSQIITL
jgi:hypothetical protein